MASSQTTREDALVCRALGFLGVVVKMGSRRSLFEQPGTLERFLEMIVLPNMALRSELELFPSLAREWVGGGSTKMWWDEREGKGRRDASSS